MYSKYTILIPLTYNGSKGSRLLSMNSFSMGLNLGKTVHDNYSVTVKADYNSLKGEHIMLRGLNDDIKV